MTTSYEPDRQPTKTKTQMSKIEYIAFGKIDDMIAEYAALDMGKEWFRQYGYRYASLPIGSSQYDTTYYQTLAEAKADVRNYADMVGCRTVRI